MLRGESWPPGVFCRAFVMVLLLALVGGCKKRVSVGVPAVADGSEGPPAGVADPPRLEAFVRAEKVPGGRVWLVWRTENTDSVVIDNGIGGVLPQGRIQLPPDGRATYLITARGPGGLTSREIRVDSEVGGQPESSRSDRQPTSLQQQFALRVRPIYFELDSHLLGDEASAALDESIAWLTRPENLSIGFVVEGHSDPVTSDEFGLALGDLRASVVRAYMLEGGGHEGRILAVSLGEEGWRARPGQGATGSQGRAVFVLSR